jgi:uridine kinase
VVKQDDYFFPYNTLPPKDPSRPEFGNTFEVPIAVNWDQMLSKISMLLKENPSFLIIEGHIMVSQIQIMDQFDFLIWLKPNKDILRKRKIEGSLRHGSGTKERYEYYFDFCVWPGYEKHGQPPLKKCNIILDSNEYPTKILAEKVLNNVIFQEKVKMSNMKNKMHRTK